MKIWSDGFGANERIPERYALGKHHPEKHVQLCENLSPPLAWSELPARTQSLVLICHDPDVPSRPDDVNKEGRTVPASLPRVDFFHWVLVDLDPALGAIAEGAFSQGVTRKGKPGPEGPLGTRAGLNNYTEWFQGDQGMEGRYFGYDGPCPPWNDSIVHHYHFTLYAIDVKRCPVEGVFTGAQVRQAIAGHVLDQAKLSGLYSINPAAR